MIRVLVADDHPVVRAAVLDLLHETDGVCAIGEAVDGQEAVELAESARPDVVLMDVSMPNLSGLEATRLLTGDRPETRVLMFSAECRPSVLQSAREAGAVGFVAKGCRGVELLRAIRAVSAGMTSWPTRP